MSRSSRWAVLLVGVGFLLALVVPASAALRLMTDEEMDAAPASGAARPLPKASKSPEERAVVPLVLAGGRATKTVKSFKALREEGVVLQALDFSCGAAALSTVLTFAFQDPVPETDIVAAILVTGQTPKEGLQKYFRRRGFTLLDLKRATESRGYRGAGYRGMTVDDLVESIGQEYLPVLVPISPMGYYHFVVVRGLRGDRVFLADPAVGNVTMKISRFEELWVDGIGFVVSRPRQRASRTGHLLASAGEAGLADAINAASKSGPGDEVPPLLAPRPGEPAPRSTDLIQILSKTEMVTPPRGMTADQTFNNAKEARVISIFALPSFNAQLQYGRPAGNFVDFTPPPGRPLQVGSQ
jgi:predicted double-glycine peptidase